MRKKVPVRWAIYFAAALAVMAGGSRGDAYEERGLEPKADYPNLKAAHKAVGKMIDRVVRDIGGAKRKSIRVTKGTARFAYWYTRDTTEGYAYYISVSDTLECPMTRLEYALDAAGWTVNNAYIVDGPDGGVMGFVSKRYFCFVEGHWDGGDATDPGYVPAPGCSVAVVCVPRRADDVPR
jgi:hypothetical protein